MSSSKKFSHATSAPFAIASMTKGDRSVPTTRIKSILEVLRNHSLTRDNSLWGCPSPNQHTPGRNLNFPHRGQSGTSATPSPDDATVSSTPRNKDVSRPGTVGSDARFQASYAHSLPEHFILNRDPCRETSCSFT